MKKPADLHVHTTLSLCCSDAEATYAAYLRAAKDSGLPAIAFTDHMWDFSVCDIRKLYAENDPNRIPAFWPVDFYEGQPAEHVLAGQAWIPADKHGIRVLFGCETEYQYGVRAISPALERELDIVLTPHSHQHMQPSLQDAPAREIAAYLLRTFRELLEIPEVTFIAHPLRPVGARCGMGAVLAEYREEDLRQLFRMANEKGKILEINFGMFPDMPKAEYRNHPVSKLWRLQKECGCKAYFGSDAHGIVPFRRTWAIFDDLMDALGYTEADVHPLAWNGPVKQ